jgi:hypothetical protein
MEYNAMSPEQFNAKHGQFYTARWDRFERRVILTRHDPSVDLYSMPRELRHDLHRVLRWWTT